MENKEIEENQRDHICEYCGLVLSQRGHLRRHISNIHLKEKPFQCEYCDFTTNQKCNLKKHSCYQKASSKSEKNNVVSLYSAEYNIQLRLEKELNGKKIVCPFGRIDIITIDTIIEIKKWEDHKKGIGQLLGYASYFPTYKKRLHFFGSKLNDNATKGLYDVCKFYDIMITFE